MRDGVSDYMPCVSGNETLTILDLSDNLIGDDGAAAILESLQYDARVLSLE